ncbi:MAG: ArsR/SmtB family transcription factor [Candidatus Saccharibacteria bacterium]
MVEQYHQLNTVFGSLSDPTRRDILKRISRGGMSIGQIARHYDLSFAAVAKHLNVLARAKLVHKTRRGKEQIVTIAPKPLAEAYGYLDKYRRLWENRLDSLGGYLKEINKPAGGKPAFGGKGESHGTD